MDGSVRRWHSAQRITAARSKVQRAQHNYSRIAFHVRREDARRQTEKRPDRSSHLYNLEIEQFDPTVFKILRQGNSDVGQQAHKTDSW